MGYIGKVPADVLIDPHVDSASIVDSTIVTADIANDAVTSAKLAANSVDSSELIDGSVDNSHLAGSIAINKTLLAGGTGLTLSTNTLNVDAAQTQITSVGTLTGLTTSGHILIDADDKALVLGADQDASIWATDVGNVYIGSGQDYSLSSSDTEGWFNFKVGTSGESFLNIVGGEGGVSSLYMTADQADDNADRWRLQSKTNGHFTISTLSSGSYVEALTVEGDGTVQTVGALQPAGNITTGGNITQSANTNLRHTITAGGSGEASLVLTANNSTGDSFVRWETNANTFCMGLDNSDGNKFILSCGSDPHSDSVINIQPDGSSIAVDKPISFGSTISMLDVAQSIDFIQSGAINFDSNGDQTGRVLTIGTNRTGDSGGTSIATFTDTGRLGIGETSPNNAIHVAANTSSTDDGVYPVIFTENGNASGNSYAGFKTRGRIDGSNNVDCYFLADGANSLGFIGTNTNCNFEVRTNGNTAMRFTNGLDIVVPGANQNIYFGGTRISGEHGTLRRRLKQYGSGSNYMTFGCYENNGYGYIENYSNSVGLYFWLGQGGSDMIVDAGSGSSIRPYQDVEFNLGESNYRFADIYASNGTIQTSDKRMKDNIKESSLGLDFINKLNPVQYKWKDYEAVKPASPEGDRKEKTIKHIFKRTHYGLVAQEVEKVLTDSGLTTKDFAPIIYDEDADRYGMRYTEMVAILIKGMQELSAEVEKLKGN